MKTGTSKRRHGLSPTRRRAVVTLFLDGLHPKQVAKLLQVTPDEVLNALRHKARRR